LVSGSARGRFPIFEKNLLGAGRAVPETGTLGTSVSRLDWFAPERNKLRVD
jgi:hypothetical protein